MIPKRGERYSGRGEIVLVVKVEGETVHAVGPRQPKRYNEPSYVKLPSGDFLAEFTLVDEAENAKTLPTSLLIYSLIDWKRLNLRDVDLYLGRVRAAEAELDARMPPRVSTGG